MPSYDLFASVSCQPGGAVVSARYTKAADSDGVEQSAKQWRLAAADGSYDQRRASTGIASTVTFSVPADGDYQLTLDGVTESWGEITVTVACNLTSPPPLVLDFIRPTDATATEGGTITGQVSGGVAPLTFTLAELGLTAAATASQPLTQRNIPAGTYPYRFVDSVSQQVSGTVTVGAYVAPVVRGCTDPAATNYNRLATEDDDSCVYAPPVRVPYFDVPAMQSLRFVVPGSTIRPAFDNVLLADETPLDYTNPGYCQKVEQGDTLVLQALSNYQGAPALELRTATGGLTRTVPGVRVQQGAGRTVSFEVYLKADVVTGRTRVYFNEESLPLPFLAGQRITISTTGTSLDGTYPIRDVLEDAAAAVPFLVLPVAYPAGSTRVDGTLTTTYVVQAYDTYQFVVSFAGVAAGCYTARIVADDNDFGRAVAVSEPIDVAGRWPHTLRIAYRNFDSAFGLDYSHGLVNYLRVTGRLIERRPATEKTVLRNDDSTLVLLAASAYRKVEAELLLLPGWLHEQLAVAFCHDSVRVDGNRVVAEGEYSSEPVQRYMLSRGTILLEMNNFLGAGNRDDLGDVDAGGGPFLLATEKFLNATTL